MTEAEWLACEAPMPMRATLGRSTSERKLRLFAAAAFRRLTFLLSSALQIHAIVILELIAEGRASEKAVREGAAAARRAIPPNEEDRTSPLTTDPHFAALMLYRALASKHAASHAVHAVAALARADQFAEACAQCHLLRDIFGNPFRPVNFVPEWRTDTALAIAQQMYESRDFSAMPILADALQDAGCENEAILSHCRDANATHVRGCWVVDLVLGKE